MKLKLKKKPDREAQAPAPAPVAAPTGPSTEGRGRTGSVDVRPRAEAKVSTLKPLTGRARLEAACVARGLNYAEHSADPRSRSITILVGRLFVAQDSEGLDAALDRIASVIEREGS